MEKNQSAIQFPCYFPIKIIGVNSEQFEEEITQLVFSHFAGDPKPHIRRQPSKQDKFISLTATVYACDQQSLDALYRALTQHRDVKMVL
jgi:putative lipoic acid-binding regulatory protein